LCYDDVAFNILTNLHEPSLKPIAMADIESDHPDLAAAKQNRSKVEYYFTCSPFIPTYILEVDSSVESITYLDADMWFYSSPEPIFGEIGDASIAIIEHRYPPARLDELSKHGVYNVSYLTFRRDGPAAQCLSWWRDRCVEWCYDRVEDGKFADQKYLDDWPERFNGVHVIKHPGAGLAPWNWMNSRLDIAGNLLTVDGGPLIFYHFHGLRIFNRWMFDAVSEGRFYGQMPRWLRKYLYRPYVRELRLTEQWLRERLPNAPVSERSIRMSTYSWRKLARKLLDNQFDYTWPY